VPDSSIELVIFDLGGVLFGPGGVAPMRKLARIENDDELWHRWLTCPWVRAFERGHCSSSEFAQGVVDDWALDLSPDDFLAAFESWPRGPYPGATALVDTVRASVPVACLSNTNVLHWESHFKAFLTGLELDFTFLSFELGMVKPDREIFEEVSYRLPVSREKALFLDDNSLNVEAATACGFAARRTQGVVEARRALVHTGVLPS
jgi:putative hydrolase of the HAD superfamily